MKIFRFSKLMFVLFFGYAFLYLPIFTVMVFSFNSSRTVMNWESFSTFWYRKLFNNQKVIDAALLSFKLAIATASLALIIGTIAAFVMVRYSKFKGKRFFNGLVTAPLVMPDVMVGVALLLLFVMFNNLTGWPERRGFATISIGHATISIAYVIIVVRARLSDFDQSLEEAALDLGARPIKVFFKITLPLIMPALASAWLLAFILSFDDVILASFLGGPGYTTLPMLIFSSVRFGVTPELNALATIIILCIALGVVTLALMTKKPAQNE